MEQSSPLATEVRDLLAKADIKQYALMQRLGIGSGTARRLLGKDPGPIDADTLAKALGLLGRELWHRKRRS